MEPHSSRVGLAPDCSRCCHLRTNGARCTMPALNGKDLCYDHFRRSQRRRMKPIPPIDYDRVPLVSFSYMEDHRSILENINAVAEAFARHSFDYRQLNAINRLLVTALKTLEQMKKIEEPVPVEEIVCETVANEDGELQALPGPMPDSSPKRNLSILQELAMGPEWQEDDDNEEEDEEEEEKPDPSALSIDY